MYSRQRMSQNSFPNHLYFPKALYNGNPKSEDSV
jgi:hypothetical protein